MHHWTHSPIQKKNLVITNFMKSMIGEDASQFVYKFVTEFRAFWQDQIDKISFEQATFEEFATAVLQTVAKRDGCHHVITFF